MRKNVSGEVWSDYVVVKERRLDFLAASLAGVLVFLACADPKILNPLNIAWLLEGDSATHLYGLLYFIRDPWTLPLGKVFSYGEGFSTSIVYTDSIPLLALVLKLFATIARTYPIFQPFGLWILLCFILQAYASFKLAKLLIPDRMACFLIAFLTCLSPPFLDRGFGHDSLMAHWLIIWALLLVLREKNRQASLLLSWPLLLVISLGVHPYIFLMCLALWAVANIHVLLIRASPVGKVLFSAGTSCSSLLFFAYLYGYFIGAPKGDSGYGYFKLNLLAPLNPMGWSIVLPSFQDLPGGEYEGFSYLGLGILLLLLTASLQPRAQSTSSPFGLAGRLLFLSLVSTTAIALSPNLNIAIFSRRASLGLLGATALALAYGVWPRSSIAGAGALRDHLWRPLISLTALLTIAGFTALLLVPLIPDRVLGLVRASGRLFWPTWYFYLFLSCVVLAGTLSRRRLALVLLFCSLLQLVDLSPGIALLNRQRFARPTLDERSFFVSTRLTDTLQSALRGKRHLSVLATGMMPHGWEQLTLLALRASAGIDKAYYARVPSAYVGAAAQRLREIDEGAFRVDTVYLVYPNYRDRVMRALARTPSFMTTAEVDDYLVLWSDHSSQ